jgi:ribosomal protein L21E
MPGGFPFWCSHYKAKKRERRKEKTGKYKICDTKESEVKNMTQKFKPGDRVRLTQDLLDTATVHPVHLYKGDEGEITEHPTQKGLLGFKSDRWGDIISFSDLVDGERRPTIDFCELVQQPEAAAGDGVAISSVLEIVNEVYGDAPKTSPWDIIHDLKQKLDEANRLIAEQDKLLKTQHELFIKQHKIIEGEEKLAALRPVRYEIATLIHDIMEDREADNSLSQALNDGWEILELSHHLVSEEDSFEYRRVVTLRRAVTEEKPRITVEVPAADVDYFIDGVGYSARRETGGGNTPLMDAAMRIFGVETDGDNG